MQCDNFLYVCTWESWDSFPAPLKSYRIKKSKYGPIIYVYGTDGFEKSTPEEKDKLEELLVRHGLTTHVPFSALNIDLAVNDLLVAEVVVTRTLPLDALLKGMNVLENCYASTPVLLARFFHLWKMQ